MACNNTCKYFYYITGASVVSGQLILTTSSTITPVNLNNFCFRFNYGVAIPASSSAYPVYIQINGTNYPVWNKYGNAMTGGELLTTTNGTAYCYKYVYKGYVGQVVSGSATTLHIITHNLPRAYCKVYLQ